MQPAGAGQLGPHHPGPPTKAWAASAAARSHGWASGDPGCLERARVVEDRGPVVAGPDVADLAVAQAVDIDAIPLDEAPARGDAENGAFLCAAHDHADHDLVALGEDVIDGDVRVGERGDHTGEQPGNVGTARDHAHGAAGPLHVGVQVVDCVVAVVLVDDVLEECFYHPLVAR